MGPGHGFVESDDHEVHGLLAQDQDRQDDRCGLGAPEPGECAGKRSRDDEVGQQLHGDPQPSPVLQVEGPLHGLEERKDLGP